MKHQDSSDIKHQKQAQIQLQFEVLPELTPEQQEALHAKHLAELNQFYSANKPYEISHWYHTLKEFTFRSQAFMMTTGEAFVIYEQYYGLSCKNAEKWKKSLRDKVEKMLNLFGGGAFFKMATRSPKDKGWDYESEQEINSVTNLLVKYIKQKLPSPVHISPAFLNQVYIFFLELSKPKLHLKSFQQFFSAFSRSERIIIDLSDFSEMKGGIFKKIRQCENSTEEEQQKIGEEEMVEVWAREWKEGSWEQEFRCFFYNYKLTAICQYDQRCFFSSLQGKQFLIQSIAVKFFDSIKKKLEQLNLSSGVMDILLTIDPPSCFLIQINPFSGHTRASLFSWKDEEELLKNGPVNTRIIKEMGKVGKGEVERMMGMVEKGVGVVVERACSQLGLANQWKSYEQ